MPGLPLGAAQQHDVDPSLQSFEHIEQIEFIEMSADYPYPRSAAYRVTQGGAQMRLRDHVPDIDDVELDEVQATRYIEELVAAGLFGLNRSYRPPQGTFLLDGVTWRLEVSFKKTGALKRPRPYRSEGEGLFPDVYDQLVAVLMEPGKASEGQ